MEPQPDRTDVAVPATLDHELRIIREAILLVASGGAARTVVAGLQLSEALLVPAGRLAEEAGVTVTPIWHLDDSGVDFEIERIGA